MKTNRAINETSNSKHFEARYMMDWKDKYNQDKTWENCQIYFKKMWNQKTRCGSGSPRKYGFSERTANVSDEITQNLD